METGLVSFAIMVFTGFFAIMNPIANAPIFWGLIGDVEEQYKKAIARKATIAAFLIVLSFVLFGRLIFDLFGISIAAFKITGGYLVFVVGLDMLRSRNKSDYHGKTITPAPQDDIAISPLAIPILAGPGTIVTAMNFSSHSSPVRVVIVIVMFGILTFMTYVMFVYGSKLVDRLGKSMLIVINKLMGLILAIIGTGMAVEGIKLAFHLAK